MPVLPKTLPIRPVLRSRPFDHEDYLFEVKYDGFRAMVYLQADNCEIVSRSRHVFTPRDDQYYPMFNLEQTLTKVPR